MVSKNKHKKMIKENKKLKQLTIEQLRMKQKKFTNVVSILSIITMFTLAALIYSAMKSDNYTFLTLCGGSCFALVLCAFILKKVETEIDSRRM